MYEIAHISGNRCGHDPKTPRFHLQNSQIALIEKAKRKLQDAYFKPKRMKKLFYSERGRRIRTDKRESLTAVTQILMHYLELYSFSVGFHDRHTGEFRPPTIQQIADSIGFTYARVKRAIAWLKEVGYLVVSRRTVRNEDGSFRGLASIRELAVSFFLDLGIEYADIWKKREWKRKRLEAKQIKASKRKGYSFKALFSAFAPLAAIRKKNAPYKPPQQALTPAQNKELYARTSEAYAHDPTRSLSDIFRELRDGLLIEIHQRNKTF